MATRASCRGPSNHNSVALILPHKAMIGFDGGAIGADIYADRTGIHARSIVDCAKILDALKDEVNGYYDPRDVFTTVPRSSVLKGGYAKHVAPGEPGSLKGVRIGVIRESMAYPKGSLAEEPIVTAADREIKEILRDKLGATLVESQHRLSTPDPEIEQMKTNFQTALARLVPVFMPDLMFRLGTDGKPLFKEFEAAIVPTEFLPGKVFGTGKMQPIDYMVGLAEGHIAPPVNFDLATVQQWDLANAFRLHIPQYLGRRAMEWKKLGFLETLVDFDELNKRSKFWGDDQRAGFANWADIKDPRSEFGGRRDVDEKIMLRELLRRVDMMVILENKLDCFVRLHTPFAPGKIGMAPQLGSGQNSGPESQNGPNAGLTEILIPAGYVKTVYDPKFKLSADGTKYVSEAATEPTPVPEPGMPFSLVFRVEPGMEHIQLRVASSYEAASKRRVMPPSFGPLN